MLGFMWIIATAVKKSRNRCSETRIIFHPFLVGFILVSNFKKGSCLSTNQFLAKGAVRRDKMIGVSMLTQASFRSTTLCLRRIGSINKLKRRYFTSKTKLFSIAPDSLTLEETSNEKSYKTEVDTNLAVSNLSSIEDLKSKRVKGGIWKIDAPTAWSKDFGSRNPEKTKELHKLANLSSGDEGYFDVSEIKVKGVTQVLTVEQARIVMKRLMSEESKKILHACDTEVMAIDVKKVGPVGNGYVTCASIYSGPDFDYGLGDGPGTSLWIDNIDDSFGLLQEFKQWFEDERFYKVWHNYGFDRHVMWSEGIDVLGFGGDTMHMARLQNTARLQRTTDRGYGLEALTSDLLARRKRPMKEIFGVARIRKDGTEGSLVDIPSSELLIR